MADVADFAEIEDDFVRITRDTVFCSFSTVDEAGRPRSRMLHPIFVVRDSRPLGWAVTGRTPLKTRHLASNPHVGCTYWSPSHDTVFVDCLATKTRRRTCSPSSATTPTPLGWGPEGVAGYGDEEWRNPVFTPLRVVPWRVQVVTGDNYPTGDLVGRVWRA